MRGGGFSWAYRIDLGDEVTAADGFLEEPVHPCGEAVGGRGGGRVPDTRHPGGGHGRPADASGRLTPAHDRHPRVLQNEAVGSGRHHLDSGGAVLRLVNVQAFRFQESWQVVPHRRGIVDDERPD